MSDSSERTAADFVCTCHKLKEHNNRHSDDCVLDNGGVGCEEGDEKSASEHEYNTHTACENTAEKHTKSEHLFASVKLKCAVVLTCECNGCLAERTYYIVCNVFKVEFSR